ncbi:hypothetical protein CU102_26045 [Phyllobacterium brassicacearum]|uniref:Uncharacterized protein n=1 Tax=Phyllobacterium brassicacearum TaxID=314235 RepID=A0A2P7B6F1_9HYPH|nr:hypothetical protein [Phyllobacterium brassicacearum]PSH62036.1 hypothetical protein CU102_26045 [Phyllobacterium brassicacearum]TDQ16699.1 hypothetical protein DEV91_13222 [Phyllobacterium brassicacearum]
MPDRHQFYRNEICGRTFIGTVCADGPYLKMLENRAYDHRVPLGSALEISKPVGRHYYAICKDNQPRIVLPMFDDEEINVVSREFGIPITGRLQALSFTESPAWKALKRWVKRHPDIARACSHTESYVPGWHSLDSNPQVQDIHID